MADVVSIVTGVVWSIEKRPGDHVVAGEVIMILESMKMEIAIEAPYAGSVHSISVTLGSSVTEGQVVARVD